MKPGRTVLRVVVGLALLSGCARARLDDAGAMPAPSATASTPADAGASEGALRVVLFSRTVGFRHASIEPAIAALRSLAGARRWTLDATEDPIAFADRLPRTDVAVFLNTAGDVLGPAEERAVEGFVARGGGFVGVHAATDTEVDWPFCQTLVGATFSAHPPGTPRGTLRVEERSHPATAHLGAAWARDDEWYSFRQPPRRTPTLHVLLSLDEGSLDLPEAYRMGDHPIAWYQHVGGGRSFTTALGHAVEAWADEALVRHVAGGIDWAGARSGPAIVVEELNGTVAPGRWLPHGDAGFDYRVGTDALELFDKDGANEHLTRQSALVDPRRPYAVDALFRIASRTSGGLDSFCINFAIQGEAGSADDLGVLDARAMNVDLAGGAPEGSVMKTMGFVRGAFRQTRERRSACCRFDAEFRLALEVRGDRVQVRVLDQGEERERFEADYSDFPWRPDLARPVRVGVNTHGADFRVRDVRVRYLD